MAIFFKHNINLVKLSVIILFSNNIKTPRFELNFNGLYRPSFLNFSALLFFWQLGITLFFTIGRIFTFKSTQYALTTVIQHYSIDSFVNFLLFYLIAYWTIPAYFYKKKYFDLGCNLILILIAYGLVGYLINQAVYFQKHFPVNGQIDINVGFGNYLATQFLAGIPFIFIAGSYRLLLEYLEMEKRELVLKYEKTKAELSFLKTQISPHTLFNALNKIYSLSQKKSDLVPDAILNLSDIMQHILYEKVDDQQRVMLDSEIELLENFLDLQRLGFTDELFIDFNVNGNTVGRKIFPLILLPLVENAFKHGLINDPEMPLEIHLTAESGRLDFIVLNKKCATKRKNATGGVGLANVAKILTLQYPDNHKLVIDEDELTYKISLTIFFYD